MTTTDHTDEAGMTTLRDAADWIDAAVQANDYMTLLGGADLTDGIALAAALRAASPAPSAPAAVPEELRRLSRAAIIYAEAYAIATAATEVFHAKWDAQIAAGIQPGAMDLTAVGEASTWARAAETCAAVVLMKAARTLAAAPAAPPAGGGTEQEQALRYAESLTRALHEKHWKVDAPEWQPLAGDLIGMLTQIDNMTVGLSRTPAGAAKMPLRDVVITGPINGMGEPNPAGPYFRLVLTKHDEREDRMLSRGAVEVLSAEIAGLLDKSTPAGAAGDLVGDDKCAHCGLPRKEHDYNGACYGLCGEFVANRPASPAPAASAGGTGPDGAYELWHIAHNIDDDAPLPSYRAVFKAGYEAALAPAAQVNLGREVIARIILRQQGYPDDVLERHEERDNLIWRDALRTADAILATRPVSEGDAVGEKLCPYDVGPGCPCRPCACHLGREGREPALHPNSPASRPASQMPAPAASVGGEGATERENKLLAEALEWKGMYLAAAKNRDDLMAAARPVAEGDAGKAEVLRAIEFALAIDDHHEARAFLDGWSHGDTVEWPEFAAGATMPDEDEAAARPAPSPAKGRN